MSLNSTCLRIAQNVLEITLSHIAEAYTERLRTTIKELADRPDRVVQLYAPSQYGKSTLVALLTDGDQWAPVGIGAATTAVCIELRSIEPPEKQRAEIGWLTPNEVSSLVRAVLDVAQPDNDTDSNTDEDGNDSESSDLENAATRRVLLRMLDRYKKQKGSQAKLDDIRQAEAMLHFYEDFQKKYTSERIPVGLKELAEYTKQPADWNLKKISDFDFHKVRFCFVKRVYLYAYTDPMVRGLCIIDSPGFGASSVHNRICREIRSIADAVIFLQGKGADIEDHYAEEISEYLEGAGPALREHVYMLWNPRATSKTLAEDSRERDLAKLSSREIVNIPMNHTGIVHLPLALRARQWERRKGLHDVTISALNEEAKKSSSNRESSDLDTFLENDVKTHFLTFVKDINYMTKEVGVVATEGLKQSGWSDVIPNIFDLIRERTRNRREDECSLRTLEALDMYMSVFNAIFATKSDKEVASAEAILKNFNNTYQTSTSLPKSNLIAVVNILVEKLSSTEERESVVGKANTIIDEKKSVSEMFAAMRLKISNHLITLGSNWGASVREFTYHQMRLGIKGAYETKAKEMREYVERATKENGLSATIDIPGPPQLQLSTKSILEDFDTAIERIIQKVVHRNVVQNILAVFGVNKGNVKKEIKDILAKLMSRGTMDYLIKRVEPSQGTGDSVYKAVQSSLKEKKIWILGVLQTEVGNFCLAFEEEVNNKVNKNIEAYKGSIILILEAATTSLKQRTIIDNNHLQLIGTLLDELEGMRSFDPFSSVSIAKNRAILKTIQNRELPTVETMPAP